MNAKLTRLALSMEKLENQNQELLNQLGGMQGRVEDIHYHNTPHCCVITTYDTKAQRL